MTYFSTILPFLKLSYYKLSVIFSELIICYFQSQIILLICMSFCFPFGTHTLWLFPSTLYRPNLHHAYYRTGDATALYCEGKKSCSYFRTGVVGSYWSMRLQVFLLLGILIFSWGTVHSATPLIPALEN